MGVSFSKTYPQWSLHPLRFPHLWGTETFFTIKEECSKIIPSFFTIKEGSTFLTKPLFPQEREDVTALRCSEPLRYKVGGASKPSPCFAGWARLDLTCYYLAMATITLTLVYYYLVKGAGYYPYFKTTLGYVL